MSNLQVTDKKNTQNLLTILVAIVGLLLTVFIGLGWKMYDKLDDNFGKVIAMETKLDLIISGQLVLPTRPAPATPTKRKAPSEPGNQWLALFKRENDNEQTKKEGKRPHRQ